MARAAHRPSRRDDILDAGLAELSGRGPGATTVADIAQRAGVTAAAVYYHFPSKDDLLLELVDRIGRQLAAVVSPPAADRFLTWLDRHEPEARLWFVTSTGVSPAIEARKRDMRREISTQLSEPLRPALSGVEADVAAIALLTLFEEVARARLGDGELAGALGPAELRAAAAELSGRITGAPLP